MSPQQMNSDSRMNEMWYLHFICKSMDRTVVSIYYLAEKVISVVKIGKIQLFGGLSYE